LQHKVIDLLHQMEAMTKERLSLDVENNFHRAIAVGWYELGDYERAWERLRKIPNSQFRGKALADFVENELRNTKPQVAPKRAWDIVNRRSRDHVGWGLVQIGVFHLRRQEWDDAAKAFARVVQCGATHGGNIRGIQISALLSELAYAFDLANEATLAVQHIDAAIRRAKLKKGPIGLWFLLNVAERTYWLQTTDLGAKALEDATVGAFSGMDDPQRIPLLCFVARIQHLVARKLERAQEALSRATDIIEYHIQDPVQGMIARSEIAETLHLCGLDDQARQRLRSISAFAERRTARPSEKADEVLAEAALGHARAADVGGAKRLLELLGDRRFDAATRAWAIIHTYNGDDNASDAEVCRISNDNFRAKIRRDLACTLIKLGRIEQALVVARRIQVDRDNALPRIALALVEGGFRDDFFKLIVPATRFPNATNLMLAGLLRLHPELAPDVSKLLIQFVPGVLGLQPETTDE
jgi:hypothetical protein